MDNPFIDFHITPSYSRGFTYTWEIADDFRDIGSWVFSVYEGMSPDGPWTKISPDINNLFMWRDSQRRLVNKSNVLYFKVTLKTKSGNYTSPVVQPYGVLPRRDFLVAREVMRQAVLHSRGMAGVECDAYLLSTFGPPCSHCLDPITGMIRDSHCKYCLGTGRDPAFSGPYRIWVDFSEDSQHQQNTDKNGTVEKKSFQARAIGNPAMKAGDAIVDLQTDKRYYVDTVAVTTEMRRIPVIQTMVLEEAPLTDKIYDL